MNVAEESGTRSTRPVKPAGELKRTVADALHDRRSAVSFCRAVTDNQPMIRRVQRTSKRQQRAADLAFWLARPMAERIAAVEALRMQVSAPAESPHAEPRLQRVCELLSARGVDYLVVGGYAMAAHGYPRYTGDATSGFGRRLKIARAF